MSEDVADSLRCTGRVKHCSKCGYTYTAGDQSWECPECGNDRRCKNPAVKGFNKCRMHGARGGRPPGSKYVFGVTVAAAFNRLFSDPKLWDMTEQQAILGVRFEQLIQRLDEVENKGIDSKYVYTLLSQAHSAVMVENWKTASTNIMMAMKELEAPAQEIALWEMIYENIQIANRVSVDNRMLSLKSEEMVHMSQVFELLTFLQQIIFRYIRAEDDRLACLNDIRKRMLQG